jgi:signal transduction histidine kinase
MLQLDPEKFSLVRMLASGFEVPDNYLGGPSAKVIGPVLLDHVIGTTVAEFDRFALDVGWDLELNIGVASAGIRAFTLCIYRGREFPFTQQEIILGEALAKQLGLAMETCRLIEEAKQSAVEREQKRAAIERSEELERASIALQETIDEVSKLHTLDDFIPHALRIVAKAFGVNSAGYFEHPDDVIYLRWWLLDQKIYGPNELPDLDSTNLSVLSQLAKGFTVPIDHLGVHFRTRVYPSIVHHRTATASPSLHSFAVSMGWDWELNVPLMVNGLADGAITLFRPEEKPFSEADFSLAQSLGKQVALAMQTSSIAEREREATLLREREHIAREIHDTLAQGFTAILIHLKTLQKQFNFPAEAIDTLNTLQHVAQDNLIEARRTLWTLRPREMSHTNIVDGVRRLIDSVERAGEIKISLKAEGSLPQIPERVENELLRIVQEALQNTLRHGEGSQIIIELQPIGLAGVNLSINDDGRGFNISAVTPGYGLIGMRERATAIGAALTIISEPGYGTKIFVSWEPSQPIERHTYAG